jgi:hypothetical protein
MLRVSFLRPLDQFNGTQRLINELRDGLRNNNYDHLLFSVAFAKSGPLLRLAPDIRAWKQSGKVIRAIFGIDLLGTSKQALEFALDNFDDVFITHSTSHVTFHTKFYLFYGENQAVCYQGSHNLTVGGTEINLEGGTKIEMDRPEDEDTFQDALSCWESLLPSDCPMTLEVTEQLIADLFDGGYIFDETITKPRQPRTVETAPGGATQEGTRAKPSPFPRTYPKPPSPIPRDVLSAAGATAAASKRRTRAGGRKRAASPTVTGEALVIQIVPHHNGEVFLSKRAVDQNPSFFGFPFTGRTTPKNPSNPSYPQREPDPVVNVIVYDRAGNPRRTVNGFRLNTVFYERKSEIRITFSPELRTATAPYSIMVIRQTEEAHDYDIEIFNPGSDRYRDYLAVCNQTLPGGGAAQPRRMGWL